MSTASEPRWLLKVLRPITEVREGEAVTALLLTLNVFLLLSAYYIIKPVREALILALAAGAEYKAYMSGVIAVLLLVLVPAYALVVDKLPRIKLVVGVTLFFAVHILLFTLAMQVPALKQNLGLVFYAWVGVFNMMVVAQFWSFANDVYDEERGTRLIPMVALGASVGAAAGSKLAESLLPLLGVSSMLIVAMLILVACAVLFLLVERREGEAKLEAKRDEKPKAPAQGDRSGAFKLVLQDKYLRWVAVFSLIFSWVNSNGEYMLGKLIKQDAVAAVAAGKATDLGARIGSMYAELFFYVNVAGVLLQTFVVARLIRWIGFRAAFLIFPLIALGDATAVALMPVLLTIMIGKTAENSADYSLNNTLRQMIWLVTTREKKYKAKQAIDTFFVRMGDVSSALLVGAGATFLHFKVREFAVVNLGLIVVWIVVAVIIGREHDRLTKARPEAAADAEAVPAKASA